MNRATKRWNHRLYSKLRFANPDEAREFMISKGVSGFCRETLWLDIDDATPQEISNLLFTYFGARILVQKTKKVSEGPPADLETGAHFVEVIETKTQLYDRELPKREDQ